MDCTTQGHSEQKEALEKVLKKATQKLEWKWWATKLGVWMVFWIVNMPSPGPDQNISSSCLEITNTTLNSYQVIARKAEIVKRIAIK